MNSSQNNMPLPIASVGLQWQKLVGMGVHDDANWDQEICRVSCMTLAEAKAFAAADDRITFFIYVKHFAVMSRHQVLHAGDAVFFTGIPSLAVQDGVDTYEKPAAEENFVSIHAAPGNSWVSIQARLQVPHCTGGKAMSYLWPGLQPGGRNMLAVRGGLQPVLRYCVPRDGDNTAAQHHLSGSGWWVCGQYVSTASRYQQSALCFGGPRMAVASGDILCSSIVFDASTKTWMQTIQNTKTRQSVIYPISLKPIAGQKNDKDTAHFHLESLSQHMPEAAHLGQCLSLFNIVAKVAYPQTNLGHDLLDLPHIDNVKLSDDKTTLNIGRMVLYNPTVRAI